MTWYGVTGSVSGLNAERPAALTACACTWTGTPSGRPVIVAVETSPVAATVWSRVPEASTMRYAVTGPPTPP
jgi:hypothetical protein